MFRACGVVIVGRDERRSGHSIRINAQSKLDVLLDRTWRKDYQKCFSGALTDTVPVFLISFGKAA
jgi:hypothetical protein